MVMTPPPDETLNDAPAATRGAFARPEAHVIVALECDRPGAGSSRHSLAGVSEVLLVRAETRGARREGSTLTLTLPSRWMSSRHARLHRALDRWRIEDLSSKNGTLVCGSAAQHLELREGDLIEVGHVMLLFREAVHAPPGTPLDVDSSMLSPAAIGMGTVIPVLAHEAEALAQIAASPVPVLLLGESGTGKEVAARAVHALSKRPGAFIAVNCGAIPAALVESQLFGHTKGAFSGAVRDEPGFVRAADGGTLFLDEIGDLPAASQAALLRVLQEGEVVPVGTTRALKVNIRVVAATHRPLESLVGRGDFRADLLARLDGFRHTLPPLRDRREDLGLLIADLLPKVAPDRPLGTLTFTSDAGRALLSYGWPLNIRELQQALARASALVTNGPVDLRHLPHAVKASLAPAPASEVATPGEGDDARLHRQLEALLGQHDGNVAEVARATGKARMQIHRWMKRLAIDPKKFRRG